MNLSHLYLMHFLVSLICILGSKKQNGLKIFFVGAYLIFFLWFSRLFEFKQDLINYNNYAIWDVDSIDHILQFSPQINNPDTTLQSWISYTDAKGHKLCKEDNKEYTGYEGMYNSGWPGAEVAPPYSIATTASAGSAYLLAN